MTQSTMPIENEQYLTCMKMLEDGMKISEIAKLTGINRSSISNWKQRKGRVPTKSPEEISIEFISNLDQQCKKEYSFMLGLYLGDGHIYQLPRTQRFTITNDKKYEQLNQLIVNTGTKIFQSEATIFDREIRNSGRCVDIIFFRNIMSYIFPQHERGKKHQRPIKLTQWQLDIIDHTQLLKGLMFSDGSSYIQTNTSSLFYNFANKSNDIINICKMCLDKLDIVYHEQVKGSVTYLIICRKYDSNITLELIGTKENPLPVS